VCEVRDQFELRFPTTNAPSDRQTDPPADREVASPPALRNECHARDIEKFKHQVFPWRIFLADEFLVTFTTAQVGNALVGFIDSFAESIFAP
jgi:hypothetical protein